MKNIDTTILIVLTLLLVGAVGAYTFFFMQVQNLQEDILATHAQVEEARQLEARTVRAQEETEQLTRDEGDILSRMVRTDDIVPFLSYVESRGQEYGVLVEVVSVSDASTDGVVTLAVTLEGSFAGVVKTLGTLEYGAYALTTRSATFEAGENGTWQARISMNALTTQP